ncbi:type I-C CRISPR-associated endonuclease Cas1 [Candidatus Nomurabacteria bacterium]|nr:type I-C CRISPR-associated endonuclease Cas1 [Candidatus Nomurabacteria bacterium]
MRQLMNTLYVLTPDCYLSKEGERINVVRNKEELASYPANILEQIVCFTYASPSPKIIELCSEYGIAITIMSPNGRFISSIDGPVKGNVLLRREQFRYADNEDFCLSISKNIIWAKIYNSVSLLKRGLKDHKDTINCGIVEDSVCRLKKSLQDMDDVASMNQLRGVEGDAAKSYFLALDELILRNRDTFFMSDRNRRPPKDPMNSMLSFFYSVLTNEVRSSLQAAGLDPYVGFMHTDRPGRPSLALDIMEEFRSSEVDRFLLKVINLGQAGPGDFSETECGGCFLNDQGRKKLIGLWHNERRSTVMHGYIQERVEHGLIPHVQSILLSRYIRGELDGYPPYMV